MVQDLWQSVCGWCGREFLVCAPCGRVRRYCSAQCATSAACESQRRARRKHQATPEGRDDHRDHQRAYRARQAARVMDGSVGNLAGSGSVCPDDAPNDHGHDQSDQRRDNALGEGRARRGDDCSIGCATLGRSSGSARTDGGTGSLVSVPNLRCSLCGERGDRVVDRPRRWPWLRTGLASLRGGSRVAGRSPPGRASARARQPARSPP